MQPENWERWCELWMHWTDERLKMKHKKKNKTLTFRYSNWTVHWKSSPHLFQFSWISQSIVCVHCAQTQLTCNWMNPIDAHIVYFICFFCLTVFVDSLKWRRKEKKRKTTPNITTNDFDHVDPFPFDNNSEKK